MRERSTFLGMVFGLALFSALLMACYLLFSSIVNSLSPLEPQVKTITAIASVVALLCALIVASGLKARGQGENNSRVVKNAHIYERFLSLWHNSLNRQEWEINSETTNLEQLLALYGSPRVITAYVNLKRRIKQEGESGDDILTLFNRLIMEMRLDLGQTELNLKENDALDLLLSHYE